MTLQHNTCVKRDGSGECGPCEWHVLSTVFCEGQTTAGLDCKRNMLSTGSHPGEGIGNRVRRRKWEASLTGEGTVRLRAIVKYLKFFHGKTDCVQHVPWTNLEPMSRSYGEAGFGSSTEGVSNGLASYISKVLVGNGRNRLHHGIVVGTPRAAGRAWSPLIAGGQHARPWQALVGISSCIPGQRGPVLCDLRLLLLMT